MSSMMDEWQEVPISANSEWQEVPLGYGKNIGADWANTQQQIGQKWQSSQTPDGINPASASVQMLSDAATGSYAPITEAAKSAYHSLPDSWQKTGNNLAGSAMQEIKSGGQAIGDYLANSPNVVAASDYIDANPKLKQGMQETSDDTKALANLMTLGAGKSLLGEASEGLVGDPLYKSGEASADTANKAYIQNLVRPKETPTQMAENAKNTIQTDGKNIYQPTPSEVKMAQTVGQIPGVGSSLTPQGNLSAIIAERTKEAQNLQATLQKNGTQVDISGSWQPNIDKAVENATDNPLVVGEGKEVHQGVINSMNKAVLNNMNPNGTLSAAGLLQARKDFDQSLPPRTFNGSTPDNVLGNTAKELRRAMNKTIGEADPSAGVADSLQKQSTLYDAADNIAPKAAGEASTGLGRALAAISPHALLGLGGTVGLDAIAHMAPQVTPYAMGAALAGGATYKGVTSPSTRMGLGYLMGGGQ